MMVSSSSPPHLFSDAGSSPRPSTASSLISALTDSPNSSHETTAVDLTTANGTTSAATIAKEGISDSLMPVATFPPSDLGEFTTTEEPDSNNVVIIFVVIAVVVAIAIAGLAIFCIIKKRKQKQKADSARKKASQAARKKTKQTNIVVKKHPRKSPSVSGVSTAKTMSAVKASPKKREKSGDSTVMVEMPALPMESTQSPEADNDDTPATIHPVEETVVVCYGQTWTRVHSVDSDDFSFDIESFWE